MSNNKNAKEKLTLYLVKTSRTKDGEIIKTGNARTPVQLNVPGLIATLYIKIEPEAKAPDWAHFLCAGQDISPDLFGQRKSVGAAVVLRLANRIFILTFGTGHHLLNQEAIERDFGLRVTLNSVDPSKLRSLDKASYLDNPLNSRTQSARDADVYELNIDSEMDMLYAVTGTSLISNFGETVTGRDALTVAPNLVLQDLPDILATTLKQYETKLPDEFSWFENIRRVKDQEIIDILDLELDGYLSTDPTLSEIWIGEPEIVDWEGQVGYSFDCYGRTPRHSLLKIEDLIAYLKLHRHEISTSVLKEQSIHVNNADYESIKSWSAYRCLYAEIESGEQRYILRNGNWYLVNTDFVSLVDKYLISIPIQEVELPTYGHDTEAEYNEFAANHIPDIFLMDKKNIFIGGPYDKVEFCDLIKGGSDFIHVKYYRSSSTLSHLFAQGSTAAEAFVGDENFRTKLNVHLPKSIALKSPLDRPTRTPIR